MPPQRRDRHRCRSRRPRRAATSPHVSACPGGRSEEHTSELQSHLNLVCRLLLEKKKKKLDDFTTFHIITQAFLIDDNRAGHDPSDFQRLCFCLTIACVWVLYDLDSPL